jgi:hypothetical protein
VPAAAAAALERTRALVRVEALLARVPEVVLALARPRCAAIRAEVVNARGGRLPFLVLLTLERTVWVALVVARGPLAALLVRLELARVDQAVACGPLWRACLRLVVADVLIVMSVGGAWRAASDDVPGSRSCGHGLIRTRQ